MDKLRLSRSKSVTDFGTGIRGDLWVIEDENGRQVTTFWTDQVSEDMARLFAAAPDLLAACKLDGEPELFGTDGPTLLRGAARELELAGAIKDARQLLDMAELMDAAIRKAEGRDE